MNWSTPFESAGSRRRMPRRSRATQTSTPRKLLLTALTMSVLVATVGMGTWAAFSATTVNNGNSFDTGSISLTDSQEGTAFLSMTDAGPGATTDGCIEVSYTSSVGASTVSLYADVVGDLGEYLTVVVTRSQANGTCAAMGTTSELYNGTLDLLPATYGSGLGGVVQWVSGTTYAYHFDITLSTASAAQGKNATAGFTWEARTV